MSFQGFAGFPGASYTFQTTTGFKVVMGLSICMLISSIGLWIAFGQMKKKDKTACAMKMRNFKAKTRTKCIKIFIAALVLTVCTLLGFSMAYRLY